jgi:hypothetical protein
VLSGLARGLRMIGDAVEDRDEQRAEAATLMLRNLRDDLAGLSTARKASGRIVRHAIIWRRRAALVVAEREGADCLDLLAGSCLMLSRTAIAVDGSLRARLAATVRYLAAAMEDLAEDREDQAARQSAR